MATDPLTLSASSVDYQQFLDEFLQRIQRYESWKDVYESGTGTTLAELVAATLAFLNTGIPVAQRETYLATARRASSIYALANTLGVRVTRRVPAKALVALTRVGDLSLTLTIPEYTQFQIGSALYFNRDRIVFPINVAQLNQLAGVYLYEGEVQSVNSFQLDDLPGFRRIALGVEGFTISNSDVRVFVNNEQWLESADPIWAAQPGEKVFNDLTNGYGDAEIVVGDGFNGRYLSNTDAFEVRYVITSGELGNGLAPTSDVQCSDFTVVSGITLSASLGGTNEKDPEYYRQVAPYIHRSKNRAVSKPEHTAIILSYPQVADVLVQTQRDIAPSDLRWMNSIRLVLLPRTADSFTPAEKSDFLTWFQTYSWVVLSVDVSVDPQPVTTNIVMNVFAFPSANLQTLRSQITSYLSTLFVRSLGTLGRTIALTDITAITAIEGVDYADLLSPTADVVMPTAWSFAKLGQMVVNIQITSRR